MTVKVELCPCPVHGCSQLLGAQKVAWSISAQEVLDAY